MDVAGEMEVEVLHRHDLRVASARRAALDPEDRSSEASRMHSTDLLPMRPMPCVSETEVVVFPSPAFVGVIAVTHMIFPSAVSRSRSSTPRSTFAF